MRQTKNIPELLAPAGSIEMMKAVIGAGADAVYIGGTKFGARAYADNPETEDLCRAIDFAHLHGVSVHMTVNTLVKEREMDALYEYVLPYYRCGVDAVLVQDLGVLKFLHEHFPDLPLHASTQMSVTGIEGIRLLAQYGVKRVVFARELSLEEICAVRAQTDMELEVFAHGALCVCYSGRCLMSSMLGGRSGNRGRCAQPCRLPYDLCVREGQSARSAAPGRYLNRKEEKYLLSPKDLCTIDLLPDLIRAGVDSLKIEGRMKKPEYAAGVTAVYRKYLDCIAREMEKESAGNANGRGLPEEYRLHVSVKDKETLLSLFNRDGFTDGYLTGHTAGMMAQENRKYTSDTEKKNEKTTETPLPQPEKLPVNAAVRCFAGEEMSLALQCGEHSVKVCGEVPQAAEKQPVSKEKIAAQIRKTGDLPYEITDLAAETDDRCFIPVSSLNRLRREAFEALEQEMLKPFRREAPAQERAERADAESGKTAERPNGRSEAESGEKHAEGNAEGSEAPAERPMPLLEVLVSTEEQLAAALREESVNRVIAEWTAVDIHDFAARCRNAGKEPYLALPFIVRHGAVCGRRGLDVSDPETLKNAADAGIAGFLARDTEGLSALIRAGYADRTMADSSLYTMNRTAQAFLREQGIGEDTAPFELTVHELRERDNSRSVLPVYGDLPLMVTAQCPMRNNGHCRMRKNANKNHAGTEMEQYAYLRDRMKQDFPVKRECTFCYNIVYNTLPLSLLTEMGKIRKMGFAGWRLMFARENAEETGRTIRAFAQERSENAPARQQKQEMSKYTKGHFRSAVE